LAKSRFPRTVPASDAVLAAYADYQYERAETAGEIGIDMVLVNLFHEPLGAPMHYRAAKRSFDRVAGECAFPVRPHMLRHMAATNWIAPGSTSTLCEHFSVTCRWRPRRLPARPGRGQTPRGRGRRGRGAVPMTGPALQLIGGPGLDRRPGRNESPGGAGWLDWLRAHPPGSGVAAGEMGRRREVVHR
jgi:hypothetical protein